MFAANSGLIDYLIFAYKITDSGQYGLILDQLPEWAKTERFYVDARAEGSPSKDEVRLMMQTLLAERFKLALHTETRRLPAYLLELDKPGTLGAKLKPQPRMDFVRQPRRSPIRRRRLLGLLLIAG